MLIFQKGIKKIGKINKKFCEITIQIKFYSVFFVGSGSTAAINSMVKILGLNNLKNSQ
jgi:hypothetical protein